MGITINGRTAILILDAQVNMFDEAQPVYEATDLLVCINSLVARARAAHIPILYVQNNGSAGDPYEHGTPGWEIHPAIAPLEGNIVIQKHTPDAFHETYLQRELDVGGIKRLVLLGM
jgi:nicotinamidase-related amidase